MLVAQPSGVGFGLALLNGARERCRVVLSAEAFCPGLTFAAAVAADAL